MTKKILLGIVVVIVLGYISINMYSQYQQTIKYGKTADKYEEDLQAKNNKIDTMQKDLEDKESLIDRQSKEVIAKEEQEIRKKTDEFVRVLLKQKPKTSFLDKKDKLKPLVTESYYKELFSDKTSQRYNLYVESEVQDLRVYIDEFKPEKDKYSVFVEFNELQNDVEDDSEEIDRKGSAKVDLERKKGEWFVSGYQRFTLESTAP
ncbi:hypothetical protein [Mammaliicoccus sp. I-M35]|uniref:hypothetical protein n=1 Tax=Mammaliicoccus sp. I-M35 TaxID=2898694 RepID=UPI001EFB425B|nr:hypothetical protein [Mammaliicoccus sp. I-M35]